MNRKFANDPNAVANKSAALKLPIRVDVADQPLRECDPLGATRSPAEDSPTAEMPVAVSREWIAWWLNLSLDRNLSAFAVANRCTAVKFSKFQEEQNERS